MAVKTLCLAVTFLCLPLLAYLLLGRTIKGSTICAPYRAILIKTRDSLRSMYPSDGYPLATNRPRRKALTCFWSHPVSATFFLIFVLFFLAIPLAHLRFRLGHLNFF